MTTTQKTAREQRARTGREVTTTMNAALDVVMKTAEQEGQGATTRLLRRGLYTMLGEVTDEDIECYVAYKVYGGRRSPGAVEDEEHESYVRATLTDLLASAE
jgi:hypothetical protein